MDEVFGSPYGVVDRVGLELRSFRRERGLGKTGEEDDLRGEKSGVMDKRVDREEITRADEV